MAVSNMFENLRSPRDVAKYTLGRGVTDFSSLEQYNLYETGYSYLVMVSAPTILEKLKDKDNEYKKLIEAYTHILEYEFRGLDGLENITADTSELTNGISTLNVITKVNMQSASTFSMRYFEKAGSVITRVHELFLRGIKDPRTQFKHYNGLIEDGTIGLNEVGYESETFNFLYLNTDNTGLQLEKAVFIVGAQPTTSELSIYNSEKGDIAFKEVGVEFNGFPITGSAVDLRAKKVLNWINNMDDERNPLGNAKPVTKNSSNAELFHGVTNTLETYSTTGMKK